MLQKLLVIQSSLPLPLGCGAFLTLALECYQFLDSIVPGGEVSCILHDQTKLLLPSECWILHFSYSLLQFVEADNKQNCHCIWSQRSEAVGFLACLQRCNSEHPSPTMPCHRLTRKYPLPSFRNLRVLGGAENQPRMPHNDLWKSTKTENRKRPKKSCKASSLLNG